MLVPESTPASEELESSQPNVSRARSAKSAWRAIGPAYPAGRDAGLPGKARCYTPGVEGLGGVCAVHWQQPATGNCTRCGNFVCPQCTEDGTYGMCLSCRERTGIGAFGLTRETTDFASVMGATWTAFQQHWLYLCAATVLQYILLLAFYAAGYGAIFGMALAAPGNELLAVAVGLPLMMLGILLSNLAYIGQLKMSLDSLEGQKPDFMDMLRQLRRTGSFLLVAILLGAAALPIYFVFGLLVFAFGAVDVPNVGAFLGMIVMMPVLTYVFLGLGFAYVELSLDPKVGAIEAMSRSWHVVSGRRWTIVALGFVCMVIWYVGALCCYLGLPPGQAFALLAMCAVYKGLRRGAGVAPDELEAELEE